MNFERYVTPYHSVKNEWNLACNIVPIHSFDSLLEKCPNRRVSQAPAYETVRHRNISKFLFSFIRFSQFFELLISFMLDCTLSQENFLTLPPPNPVFKNSLHRQFIHAIYVVSRWSTGNRGRAMSASEVIEVAGSNHSVGVILNLAWGPNNFSPSMIWSWQTRSVSQTGLGAE